MEVLQTLNLPKPPRAEKQLVKRKLQLNNTPTKDIKKYSKALMVVVVLIGNMKVSLGFVLCHGGGGEWENFWYPVPPVLVDINTEEQQNRSSFCVGFKTGLTFFFFFVGLLLFKWGDRDRRYQR